ncbi:calpain 2, (m II) large subunit [Cichlidogyrus casuarinus]|uniref:Calpain 2, (M II) large subunit n=1 Tax=Cichlidogyrus casuarinus TaxID=1844966 RepID=A0ABD2QJU0_9PLAT
MLTISEVQKFEDNNRMIQIPASEKPTALTQEQKDDLRLLHKLVSGVSGGLFAEDLLRILNEGLKTDFTQTQMTLRVGNIKQKEYSADDANEPVANGHVAPKEKPPRAKSAGKKGGFLTSCMGGVQNAREGAVKFLPKKTRAITLETSRSIISCIDSDREGCLDFDEFLELWDLLRLWRGSFLAHDADKSGAMDSFEMKNALKGAGFELDDNVYQTVISRFADKRGDIHFDEFLLCCSRLKTSMDIFEETKSQNNSVLFSESQYLTAVMYL